MYTLLIELGGADLGLLAEAVAYRSRGDSLHRLVLSPEERELLLLPHFDGEEDRLSRLYEACSASLYEYDLTRADLIAEAAKNGVRQGRHVVIFATRSEVVTAIVSALEVALGEELTSGWWALSHAESESAEAKITAFRSAEAGVLVVDRDGEEGLNLQFADVLIHFDLPLDANRLEQRTGRLDRLGRTESFDTRLLLGPEDEDVLSISPYWAWYQMVREAFALFDRSIASLQFYFDEQIPELLTTLFEGGPEAMVAAIPAQREKAEEEMRRIRQQDLLTAIDGHDQDAQRLWEKLQEAEERCDDLQQAVHDILSKVWGMRFENGRGWTTYRASHKTMLPLDVQLDRTLPLYDRMVTKYRALSASSHGRVDLVRPGSDWVNCLAALQEWDDRGQAYALWRILVDEGPLSEDEVYWGYVFDILVEADVDAFVSRGGQEATGQAALKRQGDAMFAPQFIRVVVGDGGHVLTRGPLKEALLRPVDRATDTNLHKERVGVIDRVVSQGWAGACRAACQAALDHVSNAPHLAEAIRAARRRLLFKRKQAEYQRARRKERGLAEDLEVLAHLDVLERGVSAPRFRVDAAGFVALSSRPYTDFIPEADVAPMAT